LQAPHIKLKGVSRHWGKRAALNNISTEVAPGERIALIGPSGGGKSTLIRIMAGSLKPTEGSVAVNGRDLPALSWKEIQSYRSTCRIVEQHSLLVPQISVHGNVVAGLVSNWPWHKTLRAALYPIERKKVENVLTQLGIGNRQWSKAGTLSGGQMQRVAIARAIISNPSVLLADEPTASLDPNTAKSVTQQIISLARERNMSLVFCTHWFDIVRDSCTRVIGLRNGTVHFDLPPSEVSQDRLNELYAGTDERI
jgi:phosphonate transport system ATP-binding protein